MVCRVFVLPWLCHCGKPRLGRLAQTSAQVLEHALELQRQLQPPLREVARHLLPARRGQGYGGHPPDGFSERRRQRLGENGETRLLDIVNESVVPRGSRATGEAGAQIGVQPALKVTQGQDRGLQSGPEPMGSLAVNLHRKAGQVAAQQVGGKVQ